jgi:hypothetical protein
MGHMALRCLGSLVKKALVAGENDAAANAFDRQRLGLKRFSTGFFRKEKIKGESK